MGNVQLRLALKSYRLAFHRPPRTAHGLWVEREGVLVRLENEAGQVGFGEAAPVPGFGTETVATVRSRLEALGRRPDIAQLRTASEAGGAVGSALAAALAGVTVEGTAAPWPCRHDHLPVAALLPAGREVLRVARDRAELGFRTFKWKVGVGDARDERGLLDDLLAELPSGSQLRLDANGAWDRRQAEAWLGCCAERPMIDFVEQPVAASGARADDLLSGLAEDFPTRLALDESLVGAADLHRWIDRGWRGVWVLKPALLGDPADWWPAIERHGLDVVFSSALETAVGARRTLTLAFAQPTRGRPLGTGVWPLFEQRWANGPLAMPFLRWSEVADLNPEHVWNGVS